MMSAVTVGIAAVSWPVLLFKNQAIAMKGNNVKPNGIDFQSMAQSHGYVKARQMLTQATIQSQQNKIKEVESNINVGKRPLRLKESVNIASTFGGFNPESVLDRLLKGNQNILMSEASQIELLEGLMGRKRGPNKKTLPEVEQVQIQDYQEEPLAEIVLPKLNNDIPEEQFIQDDVLRYTLESDSYTILVPNQDISELPFGLGDTLNLQLSYAKRLVCTRNNLRSLLSHHVPQLSMYHMRYLKQINLSLNKLGQLPSDFGVLVHLENLDVSHNNLSSLPDSIRHLKKLTHLDLSGNSFSSLPPSFAYLDALQKLNLSSNLFTLFPCMLVRLKMLRSLNFSRNSMIHLAVPPPLLPPEGMWTKVIDRRTGKTVQMNILTGERVAMIEKYDGTGVRRMRDLHIFQPVDTKLYRKRKMWLSVNQIQEWEPAIDSTTGLMYYKNNVSGDSSWEMPPSMDTLGDLEAMEELEIKMNSIKSLPDSFIRMFALKKLVFSKNRLTTLPEGITCLTRLSHLDLSSNELRILPTSLCQCESLEVLILSDNHLLRLPAELGRMPKLRKLDVTSNHLKQMALTLGYCETLEELRVLENPLEDPPMSEFNKGMDSLKWYLRNRHMIETRGMPPEMEFHQIGICDQVTVLAPEFTSIVRQMIASSKKDGLLNLQLLGLKEIPVDVLKMPHLKRLKVDFNDSLQLREGFPIELKGLTTLSLRACKMAILPENIYLFERLTTLSIHENRFESLPAGITELRTLTYLDASKNRIYQLPAGIERLTRLATLNLEANNLEHLPPEIFRLVRLKTLNLSKNRINDCPDSICLLTDLKVLNLEKNRLQFVPKSIGELNLIDLRVGHNQIEALAGDMFASSLGKSIKIFSCCENNLLELPWSLTRIDVEALLEADFNPYVSPPPYLMSEGLVVLQNYLHIRHVRRSLFHELIADEDFVINPAAMAPQAFEVLQDGTGFLTPDDLAEFDQAVDEYMNGEYYRCPATAEEIVASVTKLREVRETEIYLNVLNTVLDTVEKLVLAKDPRFPPACITTEQRPWGRRSEMVNVWVISLLCLLRDCAPNSFHPQGRPSLFSLIEAALPPLAFPFTVDLLKDSIRIYESPYGQIADTEQVTFPSCDCVDENRGKPRRHNPCTKASVVLVKSLYVPEEADRREIEEDEFLERFRAVEDDIRIWLQTDEGHFCQEKEIKRRKALLKEEIMLRDEMSMSQQLKIKKATDAINSVTKRKLQFETGDPYESHGFRTAAEAVRALNECTEELAKINARVAVLAEQSKKLKADLALDYNVYIKRTGDEIVQKYCIQAYNKHVAKHRFYALKHHLKRHWDGEDGACYKEWLKSHSYAGNTSEVEAMMSELGDSSGHAGTLKRSDSTSSMKSNATESSQKDQGLQPEYAFIDTDDMSKYHVILYERYKKERAEEWFSL